MSDPDLHATAETGNSGRSRSILLYVAISALILFRTLPWILWGSETTNSDEAFFGLMAKHIAGGHDFPIFPWGTSYFFAASSYLAAPLFRFFGASVGLMRLPLLGINLLAVNLMAFLIRRESRLSPMDTFICCLWLALPSLLASQELMFLSIGAVECFPILLAAWLLRKRPFWGGLLCGIGYAIRPYAIYGIPALLLLDYRQWGLRRAARNAALWGAGVIATYSAFVALDHRYTGQPGIFVPLYFKRFRHMLEDIRGFFAEIMTRTTGLQSQRLDISHGYLVRDHYTLFGLALCALGAFLLAVFFRSSWRDRLLLWERMGEKELQFGFYLALLGAVNFAVYVIQGRASPDIRFTLTLLPGMVGVYVLARQLGKSRLISALSLAFALGAAANNLYANTAVIPELRTLDQRHPTADLIAYLHRHGVTAFRGGEYFYAAYNITLSSDETLIVSIGGASRTPFYNRIYAATPRRNRAQIQFSPCPGGHAVALWYVCPPPPR